MTNHHMVDPNDPLYTVVTINSVELTSNEVIALRAVVSIGVDTLLKTWTGPNFMVDAGSLGCLRHIQSLLANGE